MGDIVSSQSVAADALHPLFNRVIAAANAAGHDDILSPLTITLGDEFQGLTDTLAAAAMLARSVRLELMMEGIDCRTVVGNTRLETPLNRERAWNMMGPGLPEARTRLNDKRDVALYRFSIAADPVLQDTLDAIGAALTLIERRWTPAQRDTIVASCRNESASAIAAARGVSVHSVYKVRQAGGFDVYVELWRALTQQLAQLDEEYGLR